VVYVGFEFEIVLKDETCIFKVLTRVRLGNVAGKGSWRWMWKTNPLPQTSLHWDWSHLCSHNISKVRRQSRKFVPLIGILAIWFIQIIAYSCLVC